MKSKFTVPLVLACVAGLALAQGPRGPRGGPGGRGAGPGGGMIPGALREELALTDQQVAQIKDLAKQQFEKGKPQREAMRKAGQELQELLKSPNPDPALVGQKTLELRKMREETKDGREAMADRIRSVLTPDQLNRLKNLENSSKSIPAARQAQMLGLIQGAEPGASGMGRQRGGRFPLRKQ
jgi:Spy/CpxP family protein refolding chaperone